MCILYDDSGNDYIVLAGHLQHYNSTTLEVITGDLQVFHRLPRLACCRGDLAHDRSFWCDNGESSCKGAILAVSVCHDNIVCAFRGILRDGEREADLTLAVNRYTGWDNGIQFRLLECDLSALAELIATDYYGPECRTRLTS